MNDDSVYKPGRTFTDQEAKEIKRYAVFLKGALGYEVSEKELQLCEDLGPIDEDVAKKVIRDVFDEFEKSDFFNPIQME